MHCVYSLWALQLKWVWTVRIRTWWRKSFPVRPVASLCPLTQPHVITFSLYPQPCGPEHTLHLIREYYLTLGGQHSSTSPGFCQRCISFCGCPKSISVVPAAAAQGTLCDLCHLSSTWTVSLSRFYSLVFLLMWTTDVGRSQLVFSYWKSDIVAELLTVNVRRTRCADAVITLPVLPPSSGSASSALRHHSSFHNKSLWTLSPTSGSEAAPWVQFKWHHYNKYASFFCL